MAKILIGSELGSYVFNHTAQTITFSGFTASIERVLLITDVTNNTIIYQFNDPLKGGAIVNNVLTLDYNTNVVGFASTDSLQIFYWSEEPQQTALLDLAISIKRDLQMIRRDPNVGINGMNVSITGSLSTVTQVNTLQVIGTSTDGLTFANLTKISMNSSFITHKNGIIS
jgi:hypothetical protein